MPNAKLCRSLLGVIFAGITVSSHAAPTTALPKIEEDTSTTIDSLPATNERPGNTLNLEKIERIQDETVMFEFQAARAKALQSLQQNNGYDASLPSSLTQTLVAPATTAGLPGTTLSALPAQTALPRVVEIAGSGKNLRTRLALSDGTAVELSAGQRIPGTGNTVKTITAQEVQITTSDGEIHTLAFTE
jgi:type IV pilus biogenesis protein PilP